MAVMFYDVIMNIDILLQVCANDMGGKYSARDKWTSFLKVRLVCQTNEDVPFVFDIIQHLVVHDGILYGTFTTQVPLL